MKFSFYNLLWPLVGVVILLVLLILVFHFQAESVQAQIASKAQRQELVGQLRFHLASASEAEKSAVLATTDEDSRSFADQSRAETTIVEGLGKKLDGLLKNGREKDLLSEFLKQFTEYQRVDDELLGLAVRNTNLKAYALAFGPAAETIKEMDAALFRLIDQSATSADANARQVMLLAANADAGALRLQTLLLPHIAEQTEGRMAELEAQMAKDDQQVRKDLKRLGALLSSSRDVAIANARYSQFQETKSQIISLSRENTNVLSLSISLNDMRKVSALCQESLSALEKEIAATRVPGEMDVLPR
jgi:hypothetical protein